MKLKFARWAAPLLVCAGTVFAEGPTQAVAIIANGEVAADDLSLAELKRIFLAEQQFWPDRTRIVLLVQPPGDYARQVVLDRIYGMSEAEYKKYWVAKMFRAEVPSGPKIVFSVNMAGELVSSIRGAITFVTAADATSTGAKVLRIDGKLPGELGYPLM